MLAGLFFKLFFSNALKLPWIVRAGVNPNSASRRPNWALLAKSPVSHANRRRVPAGESKRRAAIDENPEPDGGVPGLLGVTGDIVPDQPMYLGQDCNPALSVADLVAPWFFTTAAS